VSARKFISRTIRGDADRVKKKKRTVSKTPRVGEDFGDASASNSRVLFVEKKRVEVHAVDQIRNGTTPRRRRNDCRHEKEFLPSNTGEKASPYLKQRGNIKELGLEKEHA